MLRLALLSLVALTLALPALAQERRQVTLGVLAFRGGDAARDRWEPTVARLQQEVASHDFRLVALTLDSAAAALEAGQLHFLLTNPGHYEAHARRHSLAPLVSLRTDAPGLPRTGNRYGAVIFARNAAEAPQRLADLRGKRFGAVAPDAFGGWQLARHTMLRHGIVPERDLGELHYLGFPQSSIVQAVQDGRLDAGTVRTGVIEAMLDAGAVKPEELRVLNPLAVPGFDLALSTVLVPEWLVAATPLASEELRAEVSVALLTVQEGTRWTTPASLAPVWQVREALAVADRHAATSEARSTAMLVSGAFALLLLGLAWLALRRRGTGTATSRTGDSAEPPGPEVELTRREREVLGLIERGQTTKEIARSLAISPKTVEFHRHNLLRKHEASNVADLVRRAGLSPGQNRPT